jgi:sugar lactone lactonase YvrE
MQKAPEPRLLAHTGDVCGEGILWVTREQALYWVDNRRNLVHRYRPGAAIQTWQFDETVATLAATTRVDTLCVIQGSCLALLNVRTGEKQAYGFGLQGWPEVRYNDCGVDADGALWIGSMGNNMFDGAKRQVPPGKGQLVRLTADGHLVTILVGIGVANTVAWSPQETRFYSADTLTNRLMSYTYERGTADLHDPQPLLEHFPRGRPDGSAIDEEGSIWNCRYDGGCILRISPSGVVQEVIEMPAQNVTSCAFGDDDLQTLYVTTAVSEQRPTPVDGGLFAIRTNVKGKPLHEHRIIGT